MTKENDTTPPQGISTVPKRHAPRGPLLNRDPMRKLDPMSTHVGGDALHGRLRCSARSKQKGTQCGRTAIPGGTVCRYHGGAAPQVKLKAMERLLLLQNPAIDRLQQLIGQEAFPTVAYAASRDVLDRTMGKPAEQQTVQHTGAIRMIHELGE